MENVKIDSMKVNSVYIKYMSRIMSIISKGKDYFSKKSILEKLYLLNSITFDLSMCGCDIPKVYTDFGDIASNIDIVKVNQLHEKYSTLAMNLLLESEYDMTKEDEIKLNLLNEFVIDLVDCGCEN